MDEGESNQQQYDKLPVAKVNNAKSDKNESLKDQTTHPSESHLKDGANSHDNPGFYFLIPDLETRPLVKIDNGTTYEGQWRGEVKEGYGVQVWEDGAVY